MEGKWYTTSGGGGGRLAVLAVIAAVLLGSGAAAAVASVIVTVVIVAGVLAAVAVIGLAAVVIWRLRHEPPVSAVLAERAAAVRAEQLRGAQPAPRELHQHVHFDGTDPAAVAEILRRHGRPE